MFINYLKIAFRNLLRNKIFSFINIGGLGISLASCVFIIYFIYDEITYDRFHQNADRIYRVTSIFNKPPDINRQRFTDQVIGPYLKRVYPQVEEFARLDGFNAQFLYKDRLIEELGIYYADPSVFKVFTYPLLAGDPETVFKKVNSVVLSASLANKYFGKEAFGKAITISNKPYEVTGIMKDVPTNSDKWVNGFVNGNFQGEESEPQTSLDTYLLLNSNTDVHQFECELNKAAATIWRQDPGKLGNLYEMQALTDLHFIGGIQMDNPKGSMNNIYILMLVAGILLLIAIFNFINLMTVQSLERAKEVGIRKVVGATPGQLIKQFLSESLMTVGLAGVVAFLMIKVFYSLFHMITGKTIDLSWQSDLLIIAGAIIALVAVAFTASIYPAWILSSFKPVKVLKGSISHLPGGNATRKSFILAQFALSSALLVCLAVGISQVDRMRNSDLGFNQDQVIVIHAPSDSLTVTNLNYFKNELLKTDGVVQFSSGNIHSLPGSLTGSTLVWFKQFGLEREIQTQEISADQDYLEVMQMQLTQGKLVKNYPESQWNDLAMVNETLVKHAGWENPIDQRIETSYFGNRKKMTIVGVIKDFHFKSLHNTIDPIIYFTVPSGRWFFLKIVQSKLENIEKTWKRLLPDHPMEYFFLKDSFDKQHQAEETLLVLFGYFSLLTILISALGLYGLTIYIVEKRTKEIGIRKVMGAGVASIIRLLSKDFIKLVMVGSGFGIIVAAYSASYWLQNFAYHIELHWWLFAFPIIFIVLFSVTILAYTTREAAQENPINSLRYE